jgi:ATP-dependent protease Clp ATPase subunit
MIILICGAEGSGKTVLAKSFAKLLNAAYVNKDTYPNELKGYIDGLVAAGKTVVVDKRCQTAKAHEYINPDYVVWMDTVESKIERPPKVNYHVSEWFNDTHVELMKVVSKYMEQN